MQVKTFVQKRAGVILMTAVIALGATACFPAAPATPSISPLQNGVLQSMNADRAANGLPALSWNGQLGNLAGAWSNNMANVNSMYHQNLAAIIGSPDYAGFYTLGENLLVGPGGMTSGDMEAAWMNSAPHRANILNRSFNVVGIGFAWGPDGRVWATVDFGGV